MDSVSIVIFDENCKIILSTYQKNLSDRCQLELPQCGKSNEQWRNKQTYPFIEPNCETLFFFICKNNDADQLHLIRALVFTTQIVQSLLQLPKSEISNLLTWLVTPTTDFLKTHSFFCRNRELQDYL